jgi:hypothetical protein
MQGLSTKLLKFVRVVLIKTRVCSMLNFHSRRCTYFKLQDSSHTVNCSSNATLKTWHNSRDAGSVSVSIRSWSSSLRDDQRKNTSRQRKSEPKPATLQSITREIEHTMKSTSFMKVTAPTTSQPQKHSLVQFIVPNECVLQLPENSLWRIKFGVIIYPFY